MKIFVRQIYIEPRVNYPFSVHFQRFIHVELTKRLSASDLFLRKYGNDFTLVFNLSAKAALSQPEIRGPTVFRKTKDVEYTIFLPFNMDRPQGPATYRRALEMLIASICKVLAKLEFDVSQLSRDSDQIIEMILSDPKMISEA